MGAAAAFAGRASRSRSSTRGTSRARRSASPGALAVVIAGWTTANPTLYRAGLALQVVTPNWPRWVVTLIAGAVTTLMACSPVRLHEAARLRGGLRPAAHAGGGDRVRRALDLPEDRPHAVLGQPEGARGELARPRRLARLGGPGRGGLAERLDPPVLPGPPGLAADRGRLHRPLRPGRGPARRFPPRSRRPGARGRCGRAAGRPPRRRAPRTLGVDRHGPGHARRPSSPCSSSRSGSSPRARASGSRVSRPSRPLAAALTLVYFVAGVAWMNENEKRRATGRSVMPKVVVALLNADQEFQQLQAQGRPRDRGPPGARRRGDVRRGARRRPDPAALQAHPRPGSGAAGGHRRGAGDRRGARAGGAQRGEGGDRLDPGERAGRLRGRAAAGAPGAPDRDARRRPAGGRAHPGAAVPGASPRRAATCCASRARRTRPSTHEPVRGAQGGARRGLRGARPQRGLDGGGRGEGGRRLAASQDRGGVPARRGGRPERLDGPRARARPCASTAGTGTDVPFLGCDGLPEGGQRMVAEGVLAATVVTPSNTGPALEVVARWLQTRQTPPARGAARPRGRTRRRTASGRGAAADGRSGARAAGGGPS